VTKGRKKRIGVVGILLSLIFYFIAGIINKRGVDDRDIIKVANWNVQNLFDTQRDGGEYKKFIPNRYNWTEHIYRKKLKNLSQVICDLNADVIGLEEIENDKALRDLQNYLKRVGCEYRYRAITSSKGTPIHTALLSKIEIKEKRDIKVTRSALYRSILEVTLNTSPSLKIFVNHWSSKMHPESKRLVYAKTLRERIDRLPEGSEYIIVGDFNSNHNEYQQFQEKLNDTDGKTGINHILETVMGENLVRLNYLESVKSSRKLYNLWLELPKSDRWSYRYYRKRYSLDSIIIPKTLLDSRGWEYVKDSFKVFKPSYLFTKRGSIFKWQYKNSKHLGKGYSDHLPIYAKFKRVSEKESFESKKVLNPNSVRFVESKSREMSKYTTVEDLIRGRVVSLPIELKDVVVLFKRGRGAIIQELNGKSGILVYGSTKGLYEGGVYDIKVYKSRKYYGMPEIIDMEIVKQKSLIDVSSLIKKFEPSLMDGDFPNSQVVRDVRGVYRKGTLLSDGREFKIYFRGRGNRPEDGSKLIIKIAQIGYYKGQKELIVWSKKDYSIE
jgi:exonuclease III